MAELTEYEAREERERESRLVVMRWLRAIEEIDALAEGIALLGYSKPGLTLAGVSRVLKDNPPHEALDAIQTS